MSAASRKTTIRRRPVELPFWAWSTLAVFCVALYSTTVPVTASVYDLDLLVSFGLATLQAGSLVLAVFRPLLGSAIQLGTAVAVALITDESTADIWPLPVTGMLWLGALVLLLGIRERWTVSVGVWWASIVVLVAVIATNDARYPHPDQWGTNLTIYASYTLLVLVAAIAIGQRGRIRAELVSARRDVELEQAKRLYVEERARIARELHDVVAHSMSLIHMQALSAPYRLKDVAPSEVDQEFTEIARSARTALAEMRQLLSALRSDDDGAELLPQPQVADLEELAASTARAAEIDVTLDIDADAADTSPIVQLTVYRIVQEALSNVVRHAPGAATEIRVAVGAGGVEVTVRNAPAPASRRAAPTPDAGGLGHRGMRERVGLLGGTLVTEPTPEDGYVVRAGIPSARPVRSENP